MCRCGCGLCNVTPRLLALAMIAVLLIVWLAAFRWYSGDIEAWGDIKDVSGQIVRDVESIAEEAERREGSIRDRQKREAKTLPGNNVAVGLDALLRDYRRSR